MDKREEKGKKEIWAPPHGEKRWWVNCFALIGQGGNFSTIHRAWKVARAGLRGGVGGEPGGGIGKFCENSPRNAQYGQS